MTKEALRRVTLIGGAIDGKYTVLEVAKALKITTRHVKRLKKAVREQGEGALIHGNSGRHPANYRAEALRQKIVGLKRNRLYADTNFTHFRELLAEREHREVSYTTLLSIMKAAGIVSKKAHRNTGKKFRRRKRRSQFGELLQVDATSFDWFGTGVMTTLHGYIDDASGRIVALYMCEHECLPGYIET